MTLSPYSSIINKDVMALTITSLNFIVKGVCL